MLSKNVTRSTQLTVLLALSALTSACTTVTSHVRCYNDGISYVMKCYEQVRQCYNGDCQTYRRQISNSGRSAGDTLLATLKVDTSKVDQQTLISYPVGSNVIYQDSKIAEASISLRGNQAEIERAFKNSNDLINIQKANGKITLDSTDVVRCEADKEQALCWDKVDIALPKDAKNLSINPEST